MPDIKKIEAVRCLPPEGSAEGSVHTLVNTTGAEVQWRWEKGRWRYAARPSTRETPLRMGKDGWSVKDTTASVVLDHLAVVRSRLADGRHVSDGDVAMLCSEIEALRGKVAELEETVGRADAEEYNRQMAV